jgi:hypothetical protein
MPVTTRAKASAQHLRRGDFSVLGASTMRVSAGMYGDLHSERSQCIKPRGLRRA